MKRQRTLADALTCQHQPGIQSCTYMALEGISYCRLHEYQCQFPACMKSRNLVPGSLLCPTHYLGKTCQYANGCKEIIGGNQKYCKQHAGTSIQVKVCQTTGCLAKPEGKRKHCPQHEPLITCTSTNCDKPAYYPHSRCTEHGGGWVSVSPPRAKEKRVYEFLRTSLPNDQIKFNKLAGEYFPDIMFKRKTHVVIVEVDEHQHEEYDREKDEKRTRVILNQTRKPTILLRYNPDAFWVEGVEQTVDEADRLRTLLEQVKRHLAVAPKENLVEYLFYTQKNGQVEFGIDTNNPIRLRLLLDPDGGVHVDLRWKHTS